MKCPKCNGKGYYRVNDSDLHCWECRCIAKRSEMEELAALRKRVEELEESCKEMILVDDMGNGLCWYCGEKLDDENEDCPFCVTRKLLSSPSTEQGGQG